MKSALFLHMGPGLHAHAERALLGKTQPEVLFWDQPRVTGPSAYQQLVEAVVLKVDELFSNSGKPIRLIAHSFGGHLATEAVNLRPHAVGECVFYNTVFSAAHGFYLLLHKLRDDRHSPPDLKLKIAQFLNLNPQSKNESLWDYCQFVIQDPDFMRLYWPSPALYAKYLRLTQAAPPLAFDVFQDVLNGFYAAARPSAPSAWKGKLKMVVGKQDPLMDLGVDPSQWNRIFSNFELAVLPDSGHFSHLESHFN